MRQFGGNGSPTIRREEHTSRPPSETIRGMRVDKGRSFQEGPGPNQVTMWDLDLGAWLLLNGLGIVEAWREGPEFRIVFYDPDKRIRDLHISFLNSDCAKFAAAVKQLKKAAHSIGPRPPSAQAPR